MSIIKTREKLNNLKQWLKDKDNKNKFDERKDVLDKINLLKRELAHYKFLNRSGEKIQKVTKTSYEFSEDENIDRYRYYSILLKLNKQYIKCNCNFKENDKVLTSDGRYGFINKLIMYPEKVTRDTSGIYALIQICKNDGTKGNKLIRKERLDNSGFPIEDLTLV